LRPLHEKNRPGPGLFWRGFFTGIFIIILLLAGAAFYLYKHPDLIVKQVVSQGAGDMLADTIETIPKSYLLTNKGEILSRIDRFTNAYAQNQISREQIRAIGMETATLLADRDITQSELDNLFLKMDEILQVSD